MKKVIFIFCLVIFGLSLTTLPLRAKMKILSSVFLDTNTIKAGYTLKSIDDNLILGVWPNVFKKPTKVTIENLGRENLEIPKDKNLISDLYVFNFKQTKFNDFQKPYTLVLKYQSENSSKKAIYFYNKLLNIWSEASPSIVNEEGNFIRIQLMFPFAQAAILEEKPEIGKASWYRWKNGFFAAHPVYPKGTKVKVTNLENDKSVIVTINDWGPDKTIFPERIIDLNSVSFKEIANLSQGVIKVKAEEL